MHKYETEIKNWMPFIRLLAKRFNNRITWFEDLINEGVIAVINGMDSYTSDKGSIEGYIKNTILKSIYNAGINNSFAVHVPSGSMRLVGKDDETIKNLKGINIAFLDTFHEENYDLYENIHFENNCRDDILDVRTIIAKYDENEIASLYFFEGYNYEDISKKFGYSLATISRHINFIKKLIIKKCQ